MSFKTWRLRKQASESENNLGKVEEEEEELYQLLGPCCTFTVENYMCVVPYYDFQSDLKGANETACQVKVLAVKTSLMFQVWSSECT